MLTAYYLICALIFVGAIGYMVYEDLTIGPDPKFGYNVTNWLTWCIALLAAVPYINLAIIIVVAYTWLRYRG